MIAKLPEDILQDFFLKYREVEMRPMRGVDIGIEWKPLTLESKNDDDEVIVNSNIQSLSVSPEELHNTFFEQAQHLTEAILNQNLVTDISGKIPELTNKNQKLISAN